MARAFGNSHGFEIAGAMLTDVGRVRSSNEDAVAFVIPSNDNPAASRRCLLIVADGMGGHAAGEVASALAVEAVRRVYFSLEAPVPESLMIAFETANRAILEHAKKNPDCKGMGTTCTALAIHNGQVWLAHVGDSRAYILRGGKLTQLSDDQTLHAQMIREGLMTEEESKTRGGGNVVLRALGTGPHVTPDVWEKGMPLIEGDTLVLCSDGLWNMVDDASIAEMAAGAAPQEACRDLVGAALEAGGYDNVSVGIFAVRVPAGPEAKPQTATRRIDIAGLEAAEAAATRMIAILEDSTMSPPRTIGQYRTTERLATGGAGEVYAEIDTKVGREVAIKFLRPELASDPSFVDRFLAEAKSLGRLNHPNIATLYALPQEDDHVCMIMELVRGRTVEQIVRDRRGPLGVRESLAILAQVADGLSYAHEQGVIHRDIKPSNLMVTESGRVKIMDFGIARVRGSDRMTRAGSAVGTPLYMSPEQCRGLEGDERSDIYSLAVVLYELLAGAPPFKGTTDFELTKAHLGTQPPPLIPRIAGVEPPLESAIMTALSKRPEQRFPSMRSFSDAAGATALRGDATGIVQSYVRPAQGQAAAREPPNRVPLHTVAVALMRSRAAAIARRFRGLHPAVQGISVSVLLAMAIVAAVLLRPETGPITGDPRAGPSQSFNGGTGGKQRETPPPDNGQEGKPTFNTRTTAPPDKPSPAKVPDCIRLDYDGSCLEFASNATPGAKSQAVGQNRPQQTEASNNQERNKLTLAVFEEAEKHRNYAVAKNVAEELHQTGKPEGAYALGLLYFHGEGVDRDEKNAFDYFHEAALAGYGMAQFKLGAMYHGGFGGVRPDLKIASSWYAKAAKNGVGEAASVLSAICRKSKAGSIPACEHDWKDRAN